MTPSRSCAPRCTRIPGADALVGGQTAVNFDTQDASRHDRDLIIPIVLVVILLVLALLLRALLAPLLLIVTVVLSFVATLGVSALVFNHVFHFAGADPGVPAVRVRVPGGARDRLQHLPDDPRARGDAAARHPGRHRCAGWRSPAG